MPKNFARKTYDHWIKKNRKRFKYPPYIIESKKDSFTLRFYGIIDRITCYINKKGYMNMTINDTQGEYWDELRDFDIAERKTKDGKYYCNLCENAEHFPTRESLWVKHSFEDLLEWTNKFNIDSKICLWGKPEEGAWGATLFKDIKERKDIYKSYLENKKNKCISVLKTKEE